MRKRQILEPHLLWGTEISQSHPVVEAQVQCSYVCSVWNTANLGGIHTRPTPNGSEALAPLDISYRASGNFLSSGFGEVPKVVTVLWQRMLNQLLFKIQTRMTAPLKSVQREPCLCCYGDGNREVTRCRQPQVPAGLEPGWRCRHVRLRLSQLYQSPESAGMVIDWTNASLMRRNSSVPHAQNQ